MWSAAPVDRTAVFANSQHAQHAPLPPPSQRTEGLLTADVIEDIIKTKMQ